MSRTLKLVKTNLTQDYLKGCNIKYLTTITCCRVVDKGQYLLAEIDQKKSEDLSKTLLLATMKLRDKFKTVLLDTEEDTHIVLFRGKVYKLVDDLEYEALSDLFDFSAL